MSAPARALDEVLFECTCGKMFTRRQNLWRHKKKCTLACPQPEPAITASMFMKVLDDNKELREMICSQQEQMKDQQEQMKNQQEQIKEQQKQMAELIPKVGNNNTTHNNNQRFNLQFFLNETCKDAINWDEFVKSIEVGNQGVRCHDIQQHDGRRGKGDLPRHPGSGGVQATYPLRGYEEAKDVYQRRGRLEA